MLLVILYFLRSYINSPQWNEQRNLLYHKATISITELKLNETLLKQPRRKGQKTKE
jgi:hypothetical protein